MKCRHCDEYGFCNKYSNDAVVWKCKEDTACEDFVDGAEDEEGD